MFDFSVFFPFPAQLSLPPPPPPPRPFCSSPAGRSKERVMTIK